MKRKIYEDLVKWKNDSKGKTALFIKGARRVGKSFIAEEFAKENYKNYLLIDFSTVSDTVKDIFNNQLENLDNFFSLLSSYYHIKFYERDTLFIFDEVQLFPKARGAIKCLVKDGRYDYLETGSLVSIRKNVQDIVIPSEEEQITLNPMDFEEFMWAINEEFLYEHIRKCFLNRESVGVLHRKAMECFRKYMLIGGMPQAVETYINTLDFEKVDKVKRNILTLYRDDIQKHGESSSFKIEKLFDEIPSQLKKHDKKFKITSLGKDAKTRDYNDAFLWLDDAKIVNIAYNSNEPVVGLTMNLDNSTYKCYMADTGLLLSLSFSEKEIMSNEIYNKILFDKLEFNAGMVIENIVGQMLVSSGRKLFFFSSYSDDKEERMEIDFLIQTDLITSKHNVSAIEVKTGKNYTITSLNKFKNKYKSYLDVLYVIHTGDFKIENNIIYLPIYMTSML